MVDAGLRGMGQKSMGQAQKKPAIPHFADAGRESIRPAHCSAIKGDGSPCGARPLKTADPDGSYRCMGHSTHQASVAARKANGNSGRALGGRKTNAERQRRAILDGEPPPQSRAAPAIRAASVDLSTPEGLQSAVNDLYAAAHHAAIYDPKAISGAVSLLRLAADLQAREQGGANVGTFERLRELLS